MMIEPSAEAGDRGTGGALVAAGIALFLFIPLVLFLFVAHPNPVGLSLAVGVVLMLGHRVLARPYMRRALAAKCLWCNRTLPLPGDAAGTESLEVRSGGEVSTARFCAGHGAPAARFLAFLAGWAWPLRAGIFLPLLLLLGALAATAVGRPVPLATATDLFRLIVGVTVNVAAWGYLARGAGESGGTARVPFPLHNFTLLGIRALLWIFRLVGIWWIVLALAHLLGR
jgi:hypothetical protein